MANRGKRNHGGGKSKNAEYHEGDSIKSSRTKENQEGRKKKQENFNDNWGYEWTVVAGRRDIRGNVREERCHISSTSLFVRLKPCYQA